MQQPQALGDFLASNNPLAPRVSLSFYSLRHIFSVFGFGSVAIWRWYKKKEKKGFTLQFVIKWCHRFVWLRRCFVVNSKCCRLLFNWFIIKIGMSLKALLLTQLMFFFFFSCLKNEWHQRTRKHFIFLFADWLRVNLSEQKKCNRHISARHLIVAVKPFLVQILFLFSAVFGWSNNN